MNRHPAILPLSLYRGDDYSLVVRMWQDSLHLIPIDLTGASASGAIRQGETVMELDVVVELPNLINVKLAAADWTLAVGAANWDLQLQFAGGNIYTLLAGAVAIKGDIVQ
ncbi:MAG: hypothetical protein EHM33_05115 [Chloroflexi bacterium]|jgi:hypothetical protein|nr:MAG: hypothetical protein EHM33_05115 [Chloroflexota bacterium]